MVGTVFLKNGGTGGHRNSGGGNENYRRNMGKIGKRSGTRKNLCFIV